MEGVNKTEVR